MSFISKLKRDFYSAMPVIGPHAYIEAELLLAGKKPVGWLSYFPDAPAVDFLDKKTQRDLRLLDKAVAEGRLVNIDRVKKIPVQDGAEGETADIMMRYFCQPGQEDKMRVAILANENRQKEMTPEQDKLTWSDVLGYRKRDVLFFDNYIKLPEPLINLCIKMNQKSQRYYQQKLLEECGIDMEQLREQLRAENIIS